MFKSFFNQNKLTQAQLNVEIAGYFSEFESHVNVDEFIKYCQFEFKQADRKDHVNKLITPFYVNRLAERLKVMFPHLKIETGVQLASLSKPHQNSLAHIKHVIAVASGKGGVGKSTTAVNIARCLKAQGAKVGVLDADIYGPSIPLMFGLQNRQPDTLDGKIMQPLKTAEGILCNSIGFLVDPNEAAIWRGPMASKALVQLFNETHWGELDYLLIDLPPGTGDIQLTLTQSLPLSGALIVTTPQNIALADAKKAVAMFNKVNVAVLGLVENMSVHICRQCGHAEHIFGCEGGKKLAQQEQVNVLGYAPLDINIRETMDNGDSSRFNDAQFYSYYEAIALNLAMELFQLAQARPASQAIPMIQID